MAKKRRRQRFDFWLSLSNRADLHLITMIDELKTSRLYSDVIRKGLKLIPSLMRGDTDILFEMFPEIRTKLFLQMEADVLEKLKIEQDNEVVHHIMEMKAVITQIKNQPMLNAPMTGNVTMRRITTDEEIKLEVTKSDYNDGMASQNFLNSMSALMGTPAPKKPEPIKQLNVTALPPPVFDD